METRYIDLQVAGQEIRCTVPMPLPRTNTKSYLYLRFEVDQSWNGLKRLVVFRRSGTPTLTLALNSTTCEMPAQMMAVPAGSM